MVVDDWYNFSLDQWNNDSILNWFYMVLVGEYYDQKDFYIDAMAAYLPLQVKSFFHLAQANQVFAPGKIVAGIK